MDSIMAIIFATVVFSGSWKMVAFSVARLIVAPCTPSRPANPFSTLPTQEAHDIPEILKVTCAPWPLAFLPMVIAASPLFNTDGPVFFSTEILLLSRDNNAFASLSR
jgi:hypothetical protein